MWAIYGQSIVGCKAWERNTRNFRVGMWRSIKIKTDKNNHLMIAFLVSTFRKPDPRSADIYQEIFLSIMRNDRDCYSSSRTRKTITLITFFHLWDIDKIVCFTLS